MAKLNLNSLVLNARLLNAKRVADRMGTGFALVVATPAVLSHQTPLETQPQMGSPDMPRGYRDSTPRAGRSDGLAGWHICRGFEITRLPSAERWSGLTGTNGKRLSEKQQWFALNLAVIHATSAQSVR